MSAPGAILLHPHDNVLVVVRALSPGEVIHLGEEQVTVLAGVGVGHKLARRDIAEGEKVLRYGAPIGSATAAIARGAHVHLHNLRSDHISSHTRQATATNTVTS